MDAADPAGPRERDRPADEQPRDRLAPARRGGQRRLTFDNGRWDDNEAVFVRHGPSSGEWDRILIARDDGTIAQALVDLINGADRRAHPGENHQFRTTCLRCGEPGYLHVAVIAPDETVRIEPMVKS